MALTTAIFVGESKDWIPDLVAKAKELKVNEGTVSQVLLVLIERKFPSVFMSVKIYVSLQILPLWFQGQCYVAFLTDALLACRWGGKIARRAKRAYTREAKCL